MMRDDAVVCPDFRLQVRTAESIHTDAKGRGLSHPQGARSDTQSRDELPQSTFTPWQNNLVKQRQDALVDAVCLVKIFARDND